MEELTLNKEETLNKIISFLKEEFVVRSKTKAILALSGGIDSALCAYLCKKAGLDLYVVALPYREKGDDGLKIAEDLGLASDHIFTIDIGDIVDAAEKSLDKTIELDPSDKGNIMARARMIVQYAIARRLGGLVIGTENLSEYYLGYFTLFGDQACDISPISCLWKTQVWELSEYVGVPKWVINRLPTAGLWEGQTDEGELGFSYQDADQILHLSFVEKKSRDEIIKKGFTADVVDRILERVKNTEYKRQPCPKT